MELQEMLKAVRNDRLEFVTMRPPDSKFTILDRRVVVTAPPELVELSRRGDPQVLVELIKLLHEPGRAWAAEVLLAALTGREADIVNAFAATPGQWWDSVGKTAQVRWGEWLGEARGKLIWDSKDRVFVESR
jgi:hypothetical protein